MAARFGYAIALTALLAGSAAAQTVIVDEKFDQYADRAAFLAQWVPSVGNGTAALPTSDANYLAGLLTDDAEFPSAIPNVDGKAVDHIGIQPNTGSMVNQYGGPFDPALGQAPDFTVAPSATQKVFLSSDIFVGISGNERMSVGLRATLPDGSDPDTAIDTQNLIELGSWNANPTVLGVPGTAQTSAHFAFRAQLFGVTSPNVNPDWQYFALPPELDRADDADEIVNVSDVGVGWHTYTATITPTQITFTIDLFRDGVRNTVRDENGVVIGEGVAGEFDGEVVISVNTSAAGFNNLRIGGPSGLSSTGTGLYGFDNILLETQATSVPTNNADFNGDNIVDGADFLIWQRGFGTGNNLATGDANGDLAVTDADLTIWKNQFGTDPTPAVGAVGAVPEPTTLALAGLAMVAAGLAARRR